jgi:hypothetical protein
MHLLIHTVYSPQCFNLVFQEKEEQLTNRLASRYNYLDKIAHQQLQVTEPRNGSAAVAGFGGLKGATRWDLGQASSGALRAGSTAAQWEASRAGNRDANAAAMSLQRAIACITAVAGRCAGGSLRRGANRRVPALGIQGPRGCGSRD